MTDEHCFSGVLLRILSEMNFPERYYRYYEQFRDRERMSQYSYEDVAVALNSTGLHFAFNEREKFFSYIEKHSTGEIGLNVAFPSSAVEFILVVKIGQKAVGGPFTRLARQTMQLSNPDFTYTPPAPKIPFSNLAELQAIVHFGVPLFEEIKRAVLVTDFWEN